MDCDQAKLLFACIGLFTGSLGAYLLQSGMKVIRLKSDTKKVYEFLKGNNTRYEFRTKKNR